MASGSEVDQARSPAEAVTVSARFVGHLEGGHRGDPLTRLQEALAEQPVPDATEYRKVEDERLDVSYRAALGVLDSEADPDIKLKAIDRLDRIADRRAKLYGLDTPVKVDATVTQQTQPKAELEFFSLRLSPATSSS